MERQRTQQYSANQRENRQIRSNAKGQGQDGDGCEPRVAAKLPQAIADILAELVPPAPAAGFVEPLPGLGDVAKSAAGGGVRLFITQALLPQPVGFEGDVGFHFSVEITLFSFAV